MRTAAALLLLAALVSAADAGALLGVVAVERDGKVVVGHVLEKSPAARAKLAEGDELLKIGGREIEKAKDVDDALANAKPKDTVALVFRREGREQEATAKLIARDSYRGDFLKRRDRGKTGVEAPEWRAVEWANLGDRKAPTRESTKGKVVVFHCFQSW